jgi:hypothetical protein
MKKQRSYFDSVLLVLVLSVFPYGLLHSQEDIKVACVGNSITEGAGTVTFPLQLDDLLGEGWDVGNYGVSGRTLLRQGDFPYWDEVKFTQALDFEPDKVVIMLGTNDSKYYNWVYGDQFYTDYIALVDTFAQLSPNPEIWVCLPPKAFSGIYDINDSVIFNGIIPLIDSVNNNRTVNLLDLYSLTSDKPELFSDGIHPTTEGNNYIAKILFEALTDSGMVIVTDTNMFLGKSVNGSGFDESSSEYINDGDLASNWSTSGLPVELTLDMGSEKEIDVFQVLFADDLNKGYQYTIEGSLNSSDWTLLIDQSARNDTIALYSIDTLIAAAMRYVKLTITSFSNSSSNEVQIAEFIGLQAAGYEHAPLFAASRVNPRTIRVNIVPLYAGNAMAYYQSKAIPAPFGLKTYRSVTTSAISENSRGDIGTANAYYTVNYYNGYQVNSSELKYTYYELPSVTNVTKAENELLLFPNPSGDAVEIKYLNNGSENIQIQIFNPQGQLVWTSEISASAHSAVWNGTDKTGKSVPAGMYVCHIRNGKNIFSEKIIITRD